MGTTPSPVAPVAQQPDPVDSYYAGLASQQRQIGQNLAVTAGDNPDETGEAQRLAQRFGVSPQLVQSNLMDFRRQANVQDALVHVATGSSPVLRQQLEDPNFAAIAHDQIDNLSATEKLFNTIDNAGPDIANQYEAGHLQYERGVLGDKAKGGGATPGDWSRIREIDQRLQELGPQRTLLGGLSNMAGTLVPQGWHVAGGAAVGGVVGGGIGLLGGPFAEVSVPGGAIEGAKAGAEIMMGERAYTMAGGNAYLDMLDKGVSHDTAKWASAGVGLINAGLQVGGAKLVGDMPGVTALSAAARDAISKAAGVEIADAMTQPTVNSAVKSAVGRFLASSGEGGVLMAGQELTNQVALNAAELHDTGKFDLETDEGRTAAGRALGQAFVNGALTIGTLHAATGMLAFGADMARARDAQQAQEFFTALHDNAADSKVRERNPASYEGYIAAQAQGTPAETIYVDGKQMANVLAQSSLDPERVERVMPGLTAQVNEAAATGGDVEIPTEQYAARLAGTDVGKAMLPHMRMDPDAMSSQESAEYLNDAQAKFDEARKAAGQQMATNVAFAQSAKNVEDDVFRQIRATETMPNDMARTNAQFVRDFVATQAERANMTPEAFYDRYRYTIQRAAAGRPDELLNQGQVASPEFKQWFGDSKVLDGEGNPQVVYHGTAKSFDQFDLSKAGAGRGAAGEKALFFSRNPETADHSAAVMGAGDAGGAQVLPVYLRVENPFISKMKYYDSEKMAKEIAKAKKLGHDGIEFPNLNTKGESGTIAAFSPEQVKSAIGNRGTFDATDANILHQGEPGEVPEGMTRLYHGSATPGRYEGPAWFSTNRKYAEDYRPGAELQYVDYPTSKLEEKGWDRENQPTFNTELHSSETGPRRPVPGAGEGSGKARGGFDPSTLTTMLGQKADMSTFLHETSHYFLSVYGDLARQSDAPPEVKADMASLLKWFGVKDLDAWHGMSLEEQRPFHEQFAYNFEKYLAEGKAPSVETEGVFQRFAQWLKRVYVSIRDEVNTIYRREHGKDLPLMTGEVREVMDRMLASEDAIREREAIQNMVPMFRTAEEAGMNGDEWAAYQAMHREASDQAATELSAASIRQMQWLQNARGRLMREMQRQHDALRDVERGEAAGEVAGSDLYRAQRFLKAGELRGEDGEDIQALVGHKLDSDRVKAMFPESAPGEKPDLGKLGSMMKKGGTDPDLIAPMFGFDNGEQMVRQIADARPIEEEIDARTDQRMLERYGDMNTPEQREVAIQRALHNEARARFVGVELRALEKTTRPVRDLLAAAKSAARQMLADKPIGDITPRDYQAAEARAAREAMDAMKRGDSAAAAQAKRSQLLQNALAREAQRVRDKAETQLAYLSKFADPSKSTAKAVGADFMDRINELVAGYQLGARDVHGDDPRPLNAWVNDYYDKNGVMPSVSDEVMANLGRMHWKDMTPTQLGDLRDAVKSLDYLGRREQSATMSGKQVELDALLQELKAPLAELPHDKNRDVRADLQHGSGLTKMSAKFLDLKSGIRSLDAVLLKMEQLFQWWGAGKYAGLREAPINGGWARVFKMASDAEAAERAMRAKSGAALRSIGEVLHGAKINLDDSLDVPEMPRPGRGNQWYREELLSAALNMGNASNKAKMLQYYKWQEYEVVSAINRLLSKPEMDFVQGAWDHVGSYGQDIENQQRRLTGVTPKMIEAAPLQTKWGTYRGGYYPMVYDSFLDRNIERKSERNADRLFENNYAKPSTNDGHTIERTGYVGPVSFSLNVIARHLDQVTHDLAWREAIVDLNKILSDQGLKDEINQTWGRQYTKQLRPWLQAMANNRVFDSTMDSAWEGILRRVRSNATMMGVGFRATTILTHGTTALSNSMGELGPKWFMKGAEQFMGIDRVKATRDFVYERSPEMAHRMDEADRNLHEAIDEINRHQESFRSPTAATQLFDKVRKFAYRGVMISDMASALPTWVGAYLKGMAKEPDGGLNLSEDDAIDYANRTVRNAHGGGGVKDLAQIQRDKGPLSLATLFYSYWNHVYQRERDLGMGWKKMLTGQGSVSDMPRLLARSWFYFVLPQIAHAFWSTRQGSDEDNTLGGFAKRTAEETALGMVSGLPVFRDLASSLAEGRDYKFTPLEDAGRSFVTTTSDAYHLAAGEPVSKHALQTAANTAGYAFGLPLSQPASTTRFLWDYTNGDVDPQSLKEWYEGVLTGHIH
jgi:hypothetical protein